MARTLTTAALLIMGTLAGPAPAAAYVAGETHRTTEQPSAAVRDAQHRATLRITIWYPAPNGTAVQTLALGPPGRPPTFEAGAVAAEAPFADEARRPVILLSHGYGGTARMMSWFAAPLAAAGYVVISVDHPGNNGVDPMTAAAEILSFERAEDLKRALAAVARDKLIGPHLDSARIGAAGFSAGGFTPLLLGGARFDLARLEAFCTAHPDDGVCRPQLELAVTLADRERALKDPEIAAAAKRAPDDHSIPAVKAAFAMAPADVQGITPQSFEKMESLVWIVAGDADIVAPPATNAKVAAQLIPGAKLDMVPQAGHYAFLSTCTAAGLKVVPACAQATAQQEAHRLAIARALELFGRQIGPQ